MNAPVCWTKPLKELTKKEKAGPRRRKFIACFKGNSATNSKEEMSAGLFHGRIESVYARVTGISGEPVTDGNHFGQTIINDFGRPYQEGFNSVDGFSAWTSSGRWVGYVRAEYQHSPIGSCSAR